MSNPVIWHNPRCSKSRETLKLLEDNGYTPEVRLYLQNPPDAEELERAAAELGVVPLAMIRRKEEPAKALSEDTPQDMLFAAMAADPIIIERPIVFFNSKAAIGRPPESVLSILD
ncbi:arsenate reductase (glutaredoxin) [Vannielia litorea]|uniref:arsenate reductase (glutaredoxin) n=1 Tax=Vannielia litorea TaxID=1217970 RepID=UPI001C98D203|nr:arsenate reductase (glutaredoxin) [Vannielia litorea]MBY6050048.1 arsenate reductase (glutaredoxin) [Vannielia litorea]MBY6077462.1 arsenate reductase (glutaredoxin) [Vannielia litorea]